MTSATPTLCVLETKPFSDQKTGTSGLRKKVTVYQQENYLANFIQSVFNCLPKTDFQGQTILVSGDGRYWSREAIQLIAEIAAGNSVRKVWVGLNGWMSTPAGSAVIRAHEECAMAFLLTASHNPGGPDGDFGVKMNGRNGEPFDENVTTSIYEASKVIREVKLVRLPPLKLDAVQTFPMMEGFTVEVIDPFRDWMDLMKTIFDFPMLRKLIARKDFRFLYDAMHGIGGPYAKRLFVDELGASSDVLRRCNPLEDFGKCHPDPNLTYAAELTAEMGLNQPGGSQRFPVFGAAGDGDCDRNMILGEGWFVTPSDSVAIMASYAERCVPYFKGGLVGVARSMPTSMALKIVAEKLTVHHYEVPTGWKYFASLMDAGKIRLCGEESFGTGSDHVREKDGLWAVLFWLSILAFRSGKEIVSVKQITEEFWREYGRNYYIRYDYEGVESEKAESLMEGIRALDVQKRRWSESTQTFLENNPVVQKDEFEYRDGEVFVQKQGVRVLFRDGSRFVVRLSGTSSTGATIRLYLEKYEGPAGQLDLEMGTALKDLVAVALEVLQVQQFTGRATPCVIT